MGVSTCGVRRKYYTYFVTNSRGLPSGLQSRPHSGVSRCSALRTSKQKLGAAATLAWDRSGGSIKIFLDARGDSSTSLSPWASTRSAAYKKKNKKRKKREKAEAPAGVDGEEMALDDDRIREKHVQSIRLSCSSRVFRDGAIRRIRESNFRRCLLPPLWFFWWVSSSRLRPCASLSRSSFCFRCRFRNTLRDATDAYWIIYAAGLESCNGVSFNLGCYYRISLSILII